jgi:hypothetical protein
LPSYISEVEVDSLTHKLLLLELIQAGHSGIDRSAGSRDTCPIGVLSTGELDLDKNMVITMADRSGLDIKIREDGQELDPQLADGGVVRPLTGLPKGRDVIASFGAGERRHSLFGIVAILGIYVLSYGGLTALTNVSRCWRASHEMYLHCNCAYRPTDKQKPKRKPVLALFCAFS